MAGKTVLRTIVVDFLGNNDAFHFHSSCRVIGRGVLGFFLLDKGADADLSIKGTCPTLVIAWVSDSSKEHIL
jgi:hypothetical protein